MVEFASLQDAVALIEDGMTLGLGGMTIYRRPVAFARALLARSNPPRDLTLLGFTHGFDADLLIGGGCVAAVRSCYFGFESFGFAPMFTEKAGRGELRVIEETEASIGSGLRAAAANVGFMPSTAWIGTDLPALRPDVRTVTDPYSGETLMAFPALRPDITVLHAVEADRSGSIALNQNIGVDPELVYASRKVIVTFDTLVDTLEKSTERLVLPAPVADVLVHAPRGAWPTSCYPLYPLDGTEIMAYIEACNAGGFADYVAGLGG